MKAETRSRSAGRPPNARAVYRRVAEEMRKRILSETWARGEIMPSRRQLAATFSVSKRTIEGALKALSEEGYCRARADGRMEVQHPQKGTDFTGRLVVEVISEPFRNLVDHPYFLAFQKGVQRGLAEHQAPMLMVHDGSLRNQLPPPISNLSASGIVLYGRFRKGILDRYAKWRIPVVLCDWPYGRKGLIEVCTDNERAAFEATNRLIEWGHRKIAFVRTLLYSVRDIDWDSKERQQGYERALKEAKLPCRKDWIQNALPNERGVPLWIRGLFKTSKRNQVTAVLACDDKRARQVIESARSYGRTVPKDLSVACFQGQVPREPEISGPRINFEEMGRTAVELIFGKDRPEKSVRIKATWCEGVTVARVK